MYQPSPERFKGRQRALILSALCPPLRQRQGAPLPAGPGLSNQGAPKLAGSVGSLRLKSSHAIPWIAVNRQVQRLSLLHHQAAEIPAPH